MIPTVEYILKNMSGTPQRRKDGKLVVCVQVCGCKVCEVLLKSRDPHLASEEKEKPKEGRKEREGKGREGKGREGKGREGKGREGKGREGKGREGKEAGSVSDSGRRMAKERKRKERKKEPLCGVAFPF